MAALVMTLGLAGPTAAAPSTTAAGQWRDVATNNFHTCGIKTDSSPWCWGDNWHGKLGDGTQTDRHTPVLIN